MSPVSRRLLPAALALALVPALGCPAAGPPAGRPTALAVPKDEGPTVRHRPWGEPGIAAPLVAAIPDAQVDAGLQAAGQELLSRIVEPAAAIDPIAVSRAAARAGYPGPVRFIKILNNGAFPSQLAETLSVAAQGAPVDITLHRRDWSDGTTLWLAGWAPRLATLDPLPRALQLDDPLALRVETALPGELRLFVATPDGPVHTSPLSGKAARWLDLFHTPGVYRIEVVAEVDGRARVLLLFSVAVEAELPPPAHMAAGQLPPPDPIQAEAELYAALDALRAAHGLPPVVPFDVFTGIAREHSAFMAAAGRLGHRLPGITEGVERKADAVAFPKARFYEDVATAHAAAGAHALVVDSPGHLRNLLCETCTHATIGVALEPVLDRPPRLFVTWELLEFPHGLPREIPPR